MNEKENTFGTFVESITDLGKTSLDLAKLKTVDKTTDIVSSLIPPIILSILLVFLTLFLSISAAIWLGEFYDPPYYGYLIVAGFYGVVWLIVYIVRRSIKRKFGDYLVKLLLK
jgi:hypothetical protein